MNSCNCSLRDGEISLFASAPEDKAWQSIQLFWPENNLEGEQYIGNCGTKIEEDKNFF